MKTFLSTSFLGFALYSASVFPVTPPAPLSLTVSDPAQTKGLTVFMLELPGAALAEQAESAYWSAQGADDNLYQVYVQTPTPRTKADAPSAVRVGGLMRARRDSELRLYLDGPEGAQNVFSVPLRMADAGPGDAGILAAWAALRSARLALSIGRQDRQADDLLLSAWAKLATEVYQAEPVKQWRFNSRRGRQPDLFSLFSGEAAIQETLQQQLLQGEAATQAADVTPAQLTGPDVPSHPFAELLGHRSGGDLPIARLIPPARYFVQIEEPRKMLGWLEQSAATGQLLAGTRGDSTYLRHDLIRRYLAELYLPYPLARQLSGLVRQAALFGPDLFLTHGADMTLVLDSGGALLVDTLLRGITGKAGDAGVSAYGDAARPAYFARHGQWLIFSTSRGEAAAALELARGGGAGSLGDSAEFRYMLSLLPARAEQRGAFVYLSDPFIRAMVGPRIKITQARRHQARARLNLVAAAAALYRLDHNRGADLEELLRLGYVRESWLHAWDGDRITLDDQGVPHSGLYGTLARMRSLSEIAIDRLSVEEAAAYRRYVAEYSRFWRQFFDPIGIRVGVGEKLTVETLILPLVQNSIYNQVRAVIGGDPVTLSPPALSPRPVSVLSLKTSPELRDLFMFWARPGQEAPAELGEALHIAVYDSDPLLVPGSLKMLGGLSGGGPGGGFSDMLGIGLLGALLTQPLALFVELQDPAAPAPGSRAEYRLLARLLSGFSGLLNNSSRLERQGDTWVYTFNLQDILRFHLYIQRHDGYLAFSNHRMEFTRADGNPPRRANARLQVAFAEIRKLRPTLELHQLQQRSQAAQWDRARLLPFLLLGAPDIAQAMQAHQNLYGSRPQPMDGDTWQWQPQVLGIESTLFGPMRRPKLPDSKTLPAVADSPFSPVRDLDLSFQLEDEGVRVLLTLEPQ